MRSMLFGLMLGALASTAAAHDLGIQGRVWDIGETDMRQLVVQDLAKVDQGKIQKELMDSAENYTANLDPQRLPLALATRTRYVDPSSVLSQDIYAPIEQPDGRYEWRVLYPKGTRVNPLESVRPNKNMLFFDARDPDQREFALELLKQEPHRLMLVLTAGDPGKLSNQIRVPVYYANDSLIQRFQIQAVPSLLGVGEGTHYYELAVTDFAPPYRVQTAQRAWHGLPIDDTEVSDATAKR